MTEEAEIRIVEEILGSAAAAQLVPLFKKHIRKDISAILFVWTTYSETVFINISV